MSNSESAAGLPVAETAADDYFAQRQLKSGAVGWLLLVGLGLCHFRGLCRLEFWLSAGRMGRHVYCHRCGGLYVFMHVPLHV